MTLQEKIKSDLNIAIFKRKSSADFLKVIVAEMSRKDSKILPDEEVLKILKMMKEGATLLKNEFELNILKEYLPQVMSEEETKSVVKEIIDDNNFSSIKDHGQLMKQLNTFGPHIDKSIASKYAKQFLS